MKKILILGLLLTFLLPLLPVIPATAANTYDIIGLFDGDRVILNPQHENYSEFSHKVMVVDAGQAASTLNTTSTLNGFKQQPTATTITKVTFLLDGIECLVDTVAPFEFALTADHVGEHDLTVSVEGSSGTMLETISFTGIVGTIHDNVDENYENVPAGTSFYKYATGSNVVNSIVSYNGSMQYQLYNDGSTATKPNNSGYSHSAFLPSNKILRTHGDTKLVYYDFDYKRDSGSVQFAPQILDGNYNYPTSGHYQDLSWIKNNQGLSGATSGHITLVADYANGVLSAYHNGVMYCYYKIQAEKLLDYFKTSTKTGFMLYTSQPSKTTLYIDNLSVRTYDTVEAASFVKASVEDGEEKVSERLSSIRFSATRTPKSVDSDGITFTAGSQTLEQGIDYKVSFENDEFVVTPLHYLELDTTHTLELTGVRDAYGMKLEPYTISFTTRSSMDNLKPEITIISPLSNVRYDGGVPISLSVTARDTLATSDVDDGAGKINYVEFMMDGEVIEGSRLTVADDGTTDTYTFIWQNAPERVKPYSITAVACDNNNEITISEPINLCVCSPYNPEVSVSPTSAKVNGKIMGFSADYISVTADATDKDGHVTLVKLSLYDPYGTELATHDVTSNFDSISYTFETPLEQLGTYVVECIAYDDNDLYKGEGNKLSTEAVTTVEVRQIAKKQPALLSEDLTDKQNLAKWDFSGLGEKTITSKGISICQSGANEVTATRSYISAMNRSPWLAEIGLEFSDEKNIRKFALCGITLITFNADGSYTVGSETAPSGSYKAKTPYYITAIVNPTLGKTTVLLNGSVVGNQVSTAASAMKASAVIKVSQTTTDALSETIIKNYGIYSMTDGIDASGIRVSLFDKGTEDSSMTTVSQYPKFFTFAGAETFMESSVAGGILLLDSEKNVVSTRYEDNKLYILEKLHADSTYTLCLTTNLCNASGKGLQASKEIPIITSPKAIGIDADNTAFSQSAMPELPQNVSFNTTLEGGSGMVVMGVYVGNVLKALIPQSGTGTISVSVDLSTIFNDGLIPDNAYIEAFVVDDLTNMNPLSDTIYRLD